MSSNQHLTLYFSNNKKEAPHIARRVEYFLHEKKITEPIINKVLICIDELITNITHHAYTDNDEHAVQLECRIHDNRIELELRDDGVPFDPTQQERPNTQVSLNDREVGGLGIHLVRSLMDKVDYQREGDFNVLTLIKVMA